MTEQLRYRFGRLLRRKRLHQDRRQRELAAEVGVAVSTYSMWETGDAFPEFPTLLRVMVALDVSGDDLLALMQEPTNGDKEAA